MSPSLLGRREAFRVRDKDAAVDFTFMALSYMETTRPSLLKRDVTGAPRPSHDVIRSPYDLILLRHILRQTLGTFSSVNTCLVQLQRVTHLQ